MPEEEIHAKPLPTTAGTKIGIANTGRIENPANAN